MNGTGLTTIFDWPKATFNMVNHLSEVLPDKSSFLPNKIFLRTFKILYPKKEKADKKTTIKIIELIIGCSSNWYKDKKCRI